MTLEEAKKILEKEGFSFEGPGRKYCVVSEAFMEYESPEVCEAMQVVCSAGYMIKMFGSAFNARKERLKKEYEKNAKAPGSAENRIKEDSGVNPALAEAASQFNDALLDEQAKKIEKLTKENEDWKSWNEMQNRAIAINNIAFRNEKNRLGKEIARLNGIIHDKNEEIKRKTKGCCELITENVDLKKKLSDKDAVLSDVAEELRLSKIREKNLTELCQKYIKANEELKEKLADKVVDKIDAQALKSAESALAYKEKVISDLQEKLKSIKKNRHNERVYKKKLVEKDEVIADLGKELAEAKKLNTGKTLDFNAKCMRAARESINDVFESYAAKYAKSTLDELKENAYNSFNAKAHNLGLVGSKDGNGILDQMVGVDIAEEGADHSGVIVLCGKDITISKDEAKIIERCTKNGTELHYSEKDGFTYTNMFGDEIPIICLRGMFQVFTDEEIKNMKK